MIPILRRTAERRLALPRLDGGLNVRDGVSDILDNQLTDCKNVWFERGILQTRPATKVSETVFTNTVGQNWSVSVQASREHTAVIGGKRYTMIAETKAVSAAETNNPQTVTVRYLADEDDEEVIAAGVISIADTNAKNLVCRAAQHDGDVYCYLRYETDDGHGNEVNVYETWKIARTGSTFSAPAKVEPYAPLILTDLWGSVNTEGQADMAARGASMIEGFNLLGNRYRMQGSTYDASETAIEAGTAIINVETGQDTGERYAIYPLIYPLPGLEGTITLEYTGASGVTYTHSVVIPDAGDVNVAESAAQADGLRMFATNTHVGLLKTTASSYSTLDDVKVLDKSDFIRNNMMITAICQNRDENQDKVVNMTKSAWFGGAAYGIHGGSRLFLGGNTSESEKALVIWSDLNNPLYFSENCYTYVGDKAQRVTAFGRQGAALVIFKERELFFTLYEQGASVSAQDVTEQKVVDVVTRSAYFPVTQISGEIGCDCPDTVALCKNRLVWASSDGNVYELISQNQYTERAASCVSDMIGGLLHSQSITNLQSASAVSRDGRYMLFVPNEDMDQTNVYVMDYDSYGFWYAASYTKEQNAQAHIPWYTWELPFAADGVLNTAGKLYLFKTERYGQYKDTYVYFFASEAGGADEYTEVESGGEQYPHVVTVTAPVESMIRTKFFDFGAPAILKRVKLVDVSLGENGGEPVRIAFLSEVTHEDAGEITLKARGAAEGSAESFTNKQIRPYTFACARFGIRLEASGCIKLDKIMLTYSILGGARWR